MAAGGAAPHLPPAPAVHSPRPPRQSPTSTPRARQMDSATSSVPHVSFSVVHQHPGTEHIDPEHGETREDTYGRQIGRHDASEIPLSRVPRSLLPPLDAPSTCIPVWQSCIISLHPRLCRTDLLLPLRRCGIERVDKLVPPTLEQLGDPCSVLLRRNVLAVPSREPSRRGAEEDGPERSQRTGGLHRPRSTMYTCGGGRMQVRGRGGGVRARGMGEAGVRR